MNILDELAQLQNGEPTPVAGDDTDFLMPKQQIQKPGMKGAAEHDAFIQNRSNATPPSPSKDEIQLDADRYPMKPEDNRAGSIEMNILKDQIENVPREGLEGMPLENLRELYKFQRRQRGEPEGDDERVLEEVRKQMGALPPPRSYRNDMLDKVMELLPQRRGR